MIIIMQNTIKAFIHDVRMNELVKESIDRKTYQRKTTKTGEFYIIL